MRGEGSGQTHTKEGGGVRGQVRPHTKRGGRGGERGKGEEPYNLI